MTRASAQAGNRASKTGRYLQWWDTGPEWNAVTSAVCKVHHSTLIRRLHSRLAWWGFRALKIFFAKWKALRQGAGFEPGEKGLRHRNSRFCTLSQNGYGADLVPGGPSPNTTTDPKNPKPWIARAKLRSDQPDAPAIF